MTDFPGIMVVGLGNLIRSDDGVGVHAVRALARLPQFPPSARLLDGGTLGLELSAHIADGCHLLLLDAVDAGLPPGAVVRYRGQELYGLPGGASAHSLGFADLLITLALQDATPRAMVLLGVQPATVEWGVALSPAVETALPQLLAQALDQLRLWQAEVTPCV